MTFIGLSLVAPSPAAAWYVLLIVCHFFAQPGEKMTHEELNIIGKRKSYFNEYDMRGLRISEK